MRERIFTLAMEPGENTPEEFRAYMKADLADAGSAKLAGGDYPLLQFHFHTPSEEKIDGKSYPMVAHLVHKNASGNLAVVGVLFKEGKENAALKSVLDSMPAKEGGKVALKNAFNPAGFLPKNQGYYAFKGSLTDDAAMQPRGGLASAQGAGRTLESPDQFK